MAVDIRQGDVLDVLRTLPDESVHCVVTSPPYWWLRDYGVAGQLGLEPTPEEYVARMVDVFREVRRVMRKDGTCWVNIASSYSSARIESQHAIIRDDITDKEYREALSILLSADDPAEPRVPCVPPQGGGQAAELRHARLPKVRRNVHRASQPSGAGAGAVLLSPLRSIGQPDTEEGDADSCVHDVRQAVREVRGGDQEDAPRQTLLQRDLLVQLQPEGQPPPLAGRSARSDEPGRREVAPSGADAGQVSLPAMPCEPETGSASHPPVQYAPGRSVEGGERRNPLPAVSPPIPAPRDGVRRDPELHRIGARRRLEVILPFDQIPANARRFFRPLSVIKPKDDAMIPARLAFALQADGWWLRQDIIWHKPSPMPESVTDRCTKAHEYIFLLAKAARYFYDAEGVREEATGAPSAFRNSSRYTNQGHAPNNSGHCGDVWRGQFDSTTRNRRSVWTIASQPFAEAHFATFPTKLVEPCILAGTSAHGCCPACGAPWVRVVEREKLKRERPNDLTKRTGDDGTGNHCPNTVAGVSTSTLGYRPTCQCDRPDVVPCTVLDPFTGSGTTAIVATKLGRNFVGAELNPEYVAMAHRRIASECGLLAFGATS